MRRDRWTVWIKEQTGDVHDDGGGHRFWHCDCWWLMNTQGEMCPRYRQFDLPVFGWIAGLKFSAFTRGPLCVSIDGRAGCGLMAHCSTSKIGTTWSCFGIHYYTTIEVFFQNRKHKTHIQYLLEMYFIPALWDKWLLFNSKGQINARLWNDVSNRSLQIINSLAHILHLDTHAIGHGVEFVLHILHNVLNLRKQWYFLIYFEKYTFAYMNR